MDNHIQTNVVNLIVKTMTEESLTKADLARKLGSSRAYVTQLLQETDNNFTLETLEKVADALNRTLQVDFTMRYKT